MDLSAHRCSRTAATVVKVLPMTGLAYLEDDEHRSWAVTKSTAGLGLSALEPGQRVDLTIAHGRSFDIVTEYGALD
jgi:hypothetical protein